MSLFLFLVSCTKSGNLGGTAATSGGSFGGSVRGAITGGLSAVTGATINLMVAGNPSPLASAVSASDGSYSLTFSNPGGNGLLYLTVTGGNAGGGSNSKAQFLAIAGTTSSPVTVTPVNELTTAVTEQVALNFEILTDANGAISLSAPLNAAASSNVAAQYTNLVANGTLNTGNVNLTTGTQNGLNVLANAFASCIESPTKCSALFTTSLSSTSAAALSVLESGVNALNNSSNDASSLYTLAFPLNSTTGFTLTSSSPPSGFTFNNPLAVNSISSTAGAISSGSPIVSGIAIDSSGNLYIAGSMNSAAGTVTKISPTGALIGVFPAGTNARNLAIDAAGNVWVSDAQAGQVTELNASGTLLGTFSTGTNSGPIGVAIDASGNVWVGGNTVAELNSAGTLLGNTTAPSNFIEIDASGNVWGVSFSDTALREFRQDRSLMNSFNTSSTTLITDAIDSSGNILLTTFTGHTILKYSANGILLNTLSLSGNVRGIVTDSSGNIWAAGGATLSGFNAAGISLGSYRGTALVGLAVDSLGNIWTTSVNGALEFTGVTTGPEFFPYSGPMFPGGGQGN